jgi:hypothetical protein
MEWQDMLWLFMREQQRQCCQKRCLRYEGLFASSSHSIFSLMYPLLFGPSNNQPFHMYVCLFGRCGSIVVKALCYKPEGHGFDTR